MEWLIPYLVTRNPIRAAVAVLRHQANNNIFRPFIIELFPSSGHRRTGDVN